MEREKKREKVRKDELAEIERLERVHREEMEKIELAKQEELAQMKTHIMRLARESNIPEEVVDMHLAAAQDKIISELRKMDEVKREEEEKRRKHEEEMRKCEEVEKMLAEQECMSEELMEELIEEQFIEMEKEQQEADEEAWEEEVERIFEEDCIDVVLEAEQWEDYIKEQAEENRRIEELNADEKKMRQELEDAETLSFIREAVGTLGEEEMLKTFEEEEDVWEERGEDFDRECEEWGPPGEWEEGMVRLAEELEEEEQDLQQKTVAKRKRPRKSRLTTRKRRKTTAMTTTSSVAAGQTAQEK